MITRRLLRETAIGNGWQSPMGLIPSRPTDRYERGDQRVTIQFARLPGDLNGPRDLNAPMAHRYLGEVTSLFVDGEKVIGQEKGQAAMAALLRPTMDELADEVAGALLAAASPGKILELFAAHGYTPEGT